MYVVLSLFAYFDEAVFNPDTFIIATVRVLINTLYWNYNVSPCFYLELTSPIIMDN